MVPSNHIDAIDPNPINGKDMTKLYLASAGESFNMNSFKYVREVHQGMDSVLEFETDIDGFKDHR